MARIRRIGARSQSSSPGLTRFGDAGIQHCSPDAIPAATARGLKEVKSADARFLCAAPASAGPKANGGSVKSRIPRDRSFLLGGLGAIDHFPARRAALEFQHGVDELWGWRCAVCSRIDGFWERRSTSGLAFRTSGPFFPIEPARAADQCSAARTIPIPEKLPGKQ